MSAKNIHRLETRAKMSAYIAGMIIYKFDIEGTEPDLHISYDSADPESFQRIKSFIERNEKFNDTQKKHFCKCIDYLKDCDLPLDKYASTHIVNSSANGVKHYVEMINSNYHDNDSKPQRLYINYNPIFFRDDIDLYIGTTGNNNSDSPGARNTYAGNQLYRVPVPAPRSSSLLNLTTINFIAYVLLDIKYNDRNAVNKLVKAPFSSFFGIIFDCMIYSIIGNLGANMMYPYSAWILNGVLAVVNFQFFMNTK